MNHAAARKSVWLESAMKWTNGSVESSRVTELCSATDGRWQVKDAVMVTMTNYGCPVYHLAMVEAVDDSNQAYVRVGDEWHCSSSPRCIFNRVGVFESRRGWFGNKLVFVEHCQSPDERSDDWNC